MIRRCAAMASTRTGRSATGRSHQASGKPAIASPSVGATVPAGGQRVCSTGSARVATRATIGSRRGDARATAAPARIIVARREEQRTEGESRPRDGGAQEGEPAGGHGPGRGASRRRRWRRPAPGRRRPERRRCRSACGRRRPSARSRRPSPCLGRCRPRRRRRVSGRSDRPARRRRRGPGPPRRAAGSRVNPRRRRPASLNQRLDPARRYGEQPFRGRLAAPQLGMGRGPVRAGGKHDRHHDRDHRGEAHGDWAETQREGAGSGRKHAGKRLRRRPGRRSPRIRLAGHRSD